MAENVRQFKKINANARKKTNERGKKEREEINKHTTQQKLV